MLRTIRNTLKPNNRSKIHPFSDETSFVSSSGESFNSYAHSSLRNCPEYGNCVDTSNVNPPTETNMIMYGPSTRYDTRHETRYDTKYDESEFKEQTHGFTESISPKSDGQNKYAATHERDSCANEDQWAFAENGPYLCKVPYVCKDPCIKLYEKSRECGAYDHYNKLLLSSHTLHK